MRKILTASMLSLTILLVLVLTHNPIYAKNRSTVFLYIQIPEKLMPGARENKYAKPINAFLKKNNLGMVTGGGTMVSKSKGIMFVGVDVDVYNPGKAIPLLKKHLRALKVPKGTEIQNTVTSKKFLVW